MATSPLNVAIPSIQDLTANAARLLQQSLAQASQALGPQALGAVDLDLARSNVRALAFVQAVGVHGAYRYLRDFVARQAVPLHASGAFLDGWLATYGMARQPASVASGTVAGTGVNGAVLAAGTLMQSGAGAQFRVTAGAVVAGGAVAPSIVALVEGTAGNLAAGATLTLVTPVSGIDSAFVATAGLAGGADLESDAAANARLQQRLSAEPRGGSPADYARWALSVPGITRAWGVRNPGGPTTAGVVIMADVAGVATAPSPAQRQAVVDYIRDPRRGPPDELVVVVPTLLPVNFTLHLAPDTAAIRTGVTAALNELFLREGVPGGSIPHNHVVEAISGVAGEYNHAISAPAITNGGVFTSAGYDQLLVLGSVSFT